MSLLYECINGIIQGGILDSGDESAGGEEIASLCVSKLRGMIMVEGDANRESLLSAFDAFIDRTASKIRSIIGLQQDRPYSSVSCCTTRGCHHGMY